MLHTIKENTGFKALYGMNDALGGAWEWGRWVKKPVRRLESLERSPILDETRRELAELAEQINRIPEWNKDDVRDFARDPRWGNVWERATLMDIASKIDGRYSTNFAEHFLTIHPSKRQEAMKSFVRWLKFWKNGSISFSPSARSVRGRDWYSAEGREAINMINDVNVYLQAYNRSFWERGWLISNKYGIFGIVNQLVIESDAEALAKELHITDRQAQMLGQELGFETGPNVIPWIKRFLIIAVTSLLVSGGSMVALEAFGINIWTTRTFGPNTHRILSALGRQNTNIPSQIRKVLISKGTTYADIQGIYDGVRNENFAPNTLYASAAGIYDPWFESFADLHEFFDTDYGKISRLINQFKQTQDPEEGEAILKRIYSLCLKKLRQYEGRESEDIIDSISDGLKSIVELPSRIFGEEVNRRGTLNEVAKISRLIHQLSERGKIIHRRKFDMNRYIAETSQIQEKLDYYFHGITNSPIRSLNENSYGLPLPDDMNPSVMDWRLRQMATTKVRWENASILANVIRWIEFHYNITVPVEDFFKAFHNMRPVDPEERAYFDSVFLSNTARAKSERMSGKPVSRNFKISAIELNGITIYFKNGCTNILTHVPNISTALEWRTSIPIAVPVWTGIPSWWDKGTGGIWSSNRPQPYTRPWVRWWNPGGGGGWAPHWGGGWR